MFAKIFNSSRFGQIVIQKEIDQDTMEPSIGLYFRPDPNKYDIVAGGFTLFERAKKDERSLEQIVDGVFDSLTLAEAEDIAHFCLQDYIQDLSNSTSPTTLQ